MQRKTMLLACTACMLTAIGVAGCGENPQQKIAMLEDENEDLFSQLSSLRGEMHSAKQGGDRCQADLLAARQSNQSLRNQLAALPLPANVPDGWQAVPGGAMIAVPGNVLFGSGRITLKSDSRKVLSKIASAIKTNFADKDVYVFGHTDADPIKKSGWKDNRQLSSERSLAVVRDLQAQGISPERLVACAWGQHRPVTSNKTHEGKSKNRRVEIFAVDPTLVAAK